MKKLLTILLLFVASVSYSQDTIHIPAKVAKQIAIDLVGCDSLKAEHQLTVEQLTLVEKKVLLLTNIITKYVEKDSIYEERINNEQSKFNTQRKWASTLAKQNKKLKAKLTFTKISFSAILGGLTYLYLTK